MAMKIWSDKRYYEKIAASDKFDHPGFVRAQDICREARKILDVGCGDGSKLAKLGNNTTKRVGCEVSRLAKEYGFDMFNGVKLPYQDGRFDRVVSFFVLEHTENPEELLKEMVRVLEPKGILIILAPNYGAPNRASPNFGGSRMRKLLIGVIRDIREMRGLEWNHVEAKVVSIEDFESDFDTTVEPYLGSLHCFVEKSGVEVIEESSYWSEEKPGAKLIQKVMKSIGEKGIYPFKYWGPHLFLVAVKL